MRIWLILQKKRGIRISRLAEIIEIRKGLNIHIAQKGRRVDKQSLYYTKYRALCFSIIKYLLIIILLCVIYPFSFSFTSCGMGVAKKMLHMSCRYTVSPASNLISCKTFQTSIAMQTQDLNYFFYQNIKILYWVPKSLI